MEINQLTAVGALCLACFGALGATVRWAHREFKIQGDKLDKLEKENLYLVRLYGEVRVRLHRVKLAFDMVSVELTAHDPHSHVLASARLIMNEAFPVDDKMPPEFAELLRAIDGRE